MDETGPDFISSLGVEVDTYGITLIEKSNCIITIEIKGPFFLY